MSKSLQRIVNDATSLCTDVSMDDNNGIQARTALELASDNKILTIFSESNEVLRRSLADFNVTDWSGAIELIRDVGARVRRANDFAQEMSRHSQLIIQRSVKQTEDAERRAAAAEARAASAIMRAEKSEELALHSEARVRLAERQAAAAKAAEAEARRWLSRVLDTLKNEFKDISHDAS